MLSTVVGLAVPPHSLLAQRIPQFRQTAKPTGWDCGTPLSFPFVIKTERNRVRPSNVSSTLILAG